MIGAHPLLCFFDGSEDAGCQLCKDPGPDACWRLARYQNRFVEDVGVNLIQYRVLLRNATSVDDAINRNPMFRHSLKDDASMKGGSFNGSEEFILGCMN